MDIPGFTWKKGGSFDIAPFVSLQLTDKFALQTEAMITRFDYYAYEYSGYFGNEKLNISRGALSIPVLAKYTLRAKDRISFQLFAGPHLTANVGDWKIQDGENGIDTTYTISMNEFEKDFYEVKTPPVGLTLGTNFGIITKAGTIFIDIRFAGDLWITQRKEIVEWEWVNILGQVVDTETEERWKDWIYRSKLSFSIGYEFGFVNR